MTVCLLALGSNQGDRAGYLLAAVEELRRHPAVRVLRVSSFHETAPVGGPGGQGKYLNGAAIIETTLPAEELIALLQGIEKKLGRQRTERWGPRTIDLDLLLYGDRVIELSGLNVPHPRLAERRFVLAPAAEIARDWRHPRLNQTIGELLARLPPAAPEETGLRVITSPQQMQAEVLGFKRQGRRVAVVPTMGALHAGHLSLVEIARRHADVVVATIFVNPTQFGPQEDFSKYPRTLEADLQALSAAGCDLVFVPASDEIYPPGFSTYIEPPAVALPLEGVCRPGHFRGVATVVLKLFQLVPAEVACFGQKDYQQLLVIRRMALDLDVPIEIIPCPIVREADGLAMSSRNRYLSPAERQKALALSRALERAEQMAAGGERNCDKIAEAMREMLSKAGISRVDYAVVVDAQTLEQKPTIAGRAVALIAAFVGTTRLIDNRLLTPEP
jgi:pantoate--beta-alanine ligase